MTSILRGRARVRTRRRELADPGEGASTRSATTSRARDAIAGDALDDLDLIRDIAAGGQGAMAILFDRYKDAVFGLAMARLRDRDAALDVVSETMVALWKSAGRFEGRASVRSWMLGIAYNKIHDLHRASRTRDRAVADVRLRQEPRSEPERPLTARELRPLQRCMELLSPVLREALHLCFYEDMSSTEIASVLGVKAETVRTRLFNARQALRTCMQREPRV